MSISGRDIVNLIKANKDALKELASSIASDPEIRLAIINAAIAEVATKKDIVELRREINAVRGEMGKLREEFRTEIGEVRGEIGKLRDYALASLVNDKLFTSSSDFHIWLGVYVYP
ncbi:MAG: hypothetical protein QXX95_08500 [Nitrososphaerales archaeon]